MNFRYKAMQKMREPDELDAPTVLASPRGWIAVMVVLIVTAFAIVWAFFGRLPVNVTAGGMLTTPGGTGVVQTPFAGTVTSVAAQSSRQVDAGDVIATVQSGDGVSHDVSATYAGTVVNVAVSSGQVVDSGAPVATVERSSDSDAMVAMLFVPDSKAVGLERGEDVDLAVASAPSREFGLLRGRIESVSTYALTSGQLSGLVGGSLAAAQFSGSGPPRLVVVDLIKDAHTRSGYAWSSKSGAPFVPATQTAVTGTISLERQTPFDLLFNR